VVSRSFKVFTHLHHVPLEYNEDQSAVLKKADQEILSEAQQYSTDQLYHSALVLIDSASRDRFQGDMIFSPIFDPCSMERGAASHAFVCQWPQNTTV
jgi:hypothetical protein